jgi:transcriptional regulator with XRE-family HTH domain
LHNALCSALIPTAQAEWGQNWMKRRGGPEPVDAYVGKRIKMQRRILGVSQSDLAKAIGVTFQQVQKYENGRNRVSSSRLHRIANSLNVQVPFFFVGIEGANRPAVTDQIIDLCNSPRGLALAKAFQRVTNKKVRQSIVALVSTIAETPEAARED